MQYSSTRTDKASINFDQAVLAGLAPDGGLYLPQSWPTFSAAEIKQMQGLSYPELACKLMLPFMGDGWDEARLMPLLEKTYSSPRLREDKSKEGITFRHPDIAPLVRLDDHHSILELFHGPTLAFKDFALQFLGHLLEDILAKASRPSFTQTEGVNPRKITVIGATSGDTGSAAIAGLAGHDNINIHILYPHERVSEVQRRQMTTIAAPNVFALAVDGTFDDCQDMVKALFYDAEFNKKHNLVAVNSINWARIMAQIVYYFYAALKLGAPDKPLCFSVPTGNFGDIYAGWIARQMGLPIEKLIIATNSNDILTRCWQAGDYQMKPVIQTLSPSMDIQISSNFERLLYSFSGRDGTQIESLMRTLKADKIFALPPQIKQRLQKEFWACAVDDVQTSDTIKHIYQQHQMLIDPHTATGVFAAEAFLAQHPKAQIVTLATAHPAKFPDAVLAATGKHPPLPEHMQTLFELPERSIRINNDLEAIKTHITHKSCGTHR